MYNSCINFMYKFISFDAAYFTRESCDIACHLSNKLFLIGNIVIRLFKQLCSVITRSLKLLRV